MSEDLAALVERKLAAIFPLREDRAQARAILASIHTQGHGQDPLRIVLALLKISEGCLEGLVRAVEAVHVDFRDVLVAAEYPNQGDHGPTIDPVMRAKLRERDAAQYARWLEEDEGQGERN